MYRVLIVDDEEPVLDSYTYLMGLDDERFALAGKARSGYEALQMIHEMQPDVVFMDINIPGMDGIEVISQVVEKFPHMIFIVSTAYERFDLAQKAIPLGIFAYLVKPVSKKKFLQTLDDVFDSLKKDRGHPAGDDGKLAEHLFLKETLWRPMSSEEWLKQKERLGLHSDKGFVCLLQIENDRLGFGDQVAEELSFHYRCFHSVHLDEHLYFIAEDTDPRRFEEYFKQLLGSILPQKLCPTYAIGGVYKGSELYCSAEEAQSRLRQERSKSEGRDRRLFIELRTQIGVSDPDRTQLLFTDLWKEVFAIYCFPVARSKMASYLNLLLDDITDGYTHPEGEALPFDPDTEIMMLEDIAAWRTWSLQAIGRIYRLFDLRRSGNYPAPLIKAIEFVDAHFSESIQLLDAAEAAEVSSVYLSRLFPEHLKMNFIEYLTYMRIQRAERWIRESSLSIKVISGKVGYQDPNYFSKIFRKKTGMSPSSYAEAVRKQEKKGGKS